MVRVRFAPSPTGYLHIGGLRTALYNELMALKNGGVLVLRIEDTDRSRYVEGAVENLIRTLEWTGISWTEGPYLDAQGQIQERGEYGPYIQSERNEIYGEHAKQLLENGRAYRCFCTPDELKRIRELQEASGRPVMYDRRCRSLSEQEVEERLQRGDQHVIRLKVPETGQTEFEDAIRGKVVFQNGTIDDQVLVKSDGFPTYHLANVVDDHLMGISHVIRGEEWLPSTPKHVLLYDAFGWDRPAFAHLPLLLNPDRSKLSKRQGDVAVEEYRTQGYLPAALINFVALLGWNPTGDREVYAKEELVEGFDLSSINRGGAVMSRQKLDWLNKEYLKQMPEDQLVRLARPFLIRAGLLQEEGGRYVDQDGRAVDDEYLLKVLALERARVCRLDELAEGVEFFFRDELDYDPALIPWKKSNAAVAADRLSGLLSALDSLPEEKFADPRDLETEISALIADKGWTNAETLWPMRVALTGRKASPSPFEVAWVIGPAATRQRLKRALEMLDQ